MRSLKITKRGWHRKTIVWPILCTNNLQDYLHGHQNRTLRFYARFYVLLDTWIDDDWLKRFLSNYLGNAFDSQNSQRLEKFGISHVINATPDLPFAFKDDKQNLRVSIYDSPSENILQHFEPAIDFIDQVLSAPTNKVLVHCSAGISRSPTLVLAYMIKNENLTVEEALKKMRSLRSIIDPNFSFIAQLRVWEKKCRTKIDFKDDNRSINTSTINQSVQPRSRSSSQYCGSNSSNKNDGKTPIVVNWKTKQK